MLIGKTLIGKTLIGGHRHGAPEEMKNGKEAEVMDEIYIFYFFKMSVVLHFLGVRRGVSKRAVVYVSVSSS
jgi:hypothetical protein